MFFFLSFFGNYSEWMDEQEMNEFTASVKYNDNFHRNDKWKFLSHLLSREKKMKVITLNNMSMHFIQCLNANFFFLNRKMMKVNVFFNKKNFFAKYYKFYCFYFILSPVVQSFNKF